MAFRIHLVIILSLLLDSVSAQVLDFIRNPSFEDQARQSHPPRGWEDCSYRSESPVDVHSAETSIFSVQALPVDGNTFLGMVTRDNGTHEGVSTKLLQPLLQDSLYEITFYYKKADKYLSPSRSANLDTVVNYDAPVILEVWGSDLSCQEDLFLFGSEPPQTGDWQPVFFEFIPKKDISVLTFKVKNIGYEYKNGHLLLDFVNINKI